MSTTILDGVCSRKPAQNCDCAAFGCGWYGSDITIQATNWLADGHAPRLVRHALTTLRMIEYQHNIIMWSRFAHVYCISSKSHRGKILFQGPVWCGNNSRAVFTEIVCMYNARVHTYVVIDPLPHDKILRAVFIGMSWLKYAVRFRGNTVIS